MSDWQVGDLAVCVSCLPCETCGYCSTEVRVGETYEVAGVMGEGGETYLYLPAVPPTDHEHWDSEPWYLEKQFRKIIPDKHEECEPEFVTLLKRSKRTVNA